MNALTGLRKVPSTVSQGVLTLAAVLAGLSFSGVTAAQETEQQGPAVLEEIIVTANRREERLIDVSIAVTPITGAELEAFGIPDLTYLSQMSPNTTIEVTPGTNTTMTAYIRGIGQQDPLAGFETGVGLYLDDVYLNRPQGAILDIYDVERIEVLRGPQGTLYGRNTIGGAIRYITRRLTDEPMVSTELSYGTDNLLEAVLSASAPLTDGVRIGASAALFGRDGFGENLYQDSDNYDKDVLGLRASMEWDASDELDFRLAADYVKDNSNTRQGHHLLPGKFTGAPVLDDVFDTEAGLDFPSQSVTAWGLSLVAQWHASDLVMVKNILALREDESWLAMDFDTLPWAEYDVSIHYENEQFSEELQLLFAADRWNGILGLYYLDARAFDAFDQIRATSGPPPGLNFFSMGDVDTSTWSVYGDFTFSFDDQWSVDLGGRFTQDKRSSRILGETYPGVASPWFGGTAMPVETYSDFQGDETFSRFTPRAVLNWSHGADLHLYLSYSQGFRSGGFNPRGQTSAAPDTDGDGVVSEAEIFEFLKFDSSTVDSWELGLKTILAGGRVTSNLAIFFSKYKDVQIPGSVSGDFNGDGIIEYVTAVTNAARAEINGFEWEGHAILAQNIGRHGQLNFGWVIGHLDPEFKEFEFFGQDVADQRKFRNTPGWTATGTLGYIVPVRAFDTAGVLSVITSLAYRGATTQFDHPTPELNQPAYILWDVSAVWSDTSGHWSVGIHGKNLTNNEYIVSGFYIPGLGKDGIVTAFYGNPRQVWGTAQYRWF